MDKGEQKFKTSIEAHLIKNSIEVFEKMLPRILKIDSKLSSGSDTIPRKHISFFPG